jgi:hypothetical protein
VRASSSGNMQAYSVVVTRDPALRERLHAPHMGQDMVLEAPALLTFCADFRRMRRWLALSDAEDGFDDFFAFMVAAIDAVLVAQNVALAAEAEGLGICYLGSTLANCDEIGRLLELPPGVVPVTGMVMGTPAEDPPLRDRLPLDGLVHFETYRDPDDDGIRAIYRERDRAGWERYMAIPELRARVEAAGVRNLAQIYTTVKYTREAHARFAANVLGYLRAQGFLAPDASGRRRPAARASRPMRPERRVRRTRGHQRGRPLARRRAACPSAAWSPARTSARWTTSRRRDAARRQRAHRAGGGGPRAPRRRRGLAGPRRRRLRHVSLHPDRVGPLPRARRVVRPRRGGRARRGRPPPTARVLARRPRRRRDRLGARRRPPPGHRRLPRRAGARPGRAPGDLRPRARGSAAGRGRLDRRRNCEKPSRIIRPHSGLGG